MPFEARSGVAPNPTTLAPASPKPRLSIGQRCDLAGQILAAVITSGLIAAPFIAGTSLNDAPRIEGVVSLVSPSPLPVLSEPQLPAPSLPAPRRARSAARLRAPLQSRPVTLVNFTAAVGTTGRIDFPEKKDGFRKTFGRKLAGLFIGSRSVPVRPFPTVPQ